MSKTRTPRTIGLGSIASWYKLSHAAVLRGFIVASDSRAEGAIIRGCPATVQEQVPGAIPTEVFCITLSWGENITITATLHPDNGWLMWFVPQLPADCGRARLRYILTHDENAVFDDRMWSYNIAAMTYLEGKAEHIGAKIWRGIGSDLTDAWPAVERFAESQRAKKRRQEYSIARLQQRGWRKEGDFMLMPGLCAGRIKLSPLGGGLVSAQEYPIPLDDLAAFLERYRRT